MQIEILGNLIRRYNIENFEVKNHRVILYINSNKYELYESDIEKIIEKEIISNMTKKILESCLDIIMIKKIEVLRPI